MVTGTAKTASITLPGGETLRIVVSVDGNDAAKCQRLAEIHAGVIEYEQRKCARKSGELMGMVNKSPPTP